MEHFRSFYLTGIRHKHQFPFPWARAQSRWRQTIFLETFPRSLFLGFRSFVPGLNGFGIFILSERKWRLFSGYIDRAIIVICSLTCYRPPLQTLSQIRSRLQFATIQLARLEGRRVLWKYLILPILIFSVWNSEASWLQQILGYHRYQSLKWSLSLLRNFLYRPRFLQFCILESNRASQILCCSEENSNKGKWEIQPRYILAPCLRKFSIVLRNSWSSRSWG